MHKALQRAGVVSRHRLKTVKATQHKPSSVVTKADHVAYLRYLSKHTAVLDEPFVNPVMQDMIDMGLAYVSKREVKKFGHQHYNCAFVSITEEGKAYLKAAE